MKNETGTRLILPVKTRKQIASEFGIDARTFYRWCKKFDLDIPSGNICPRHQQLIYDTLGVPPQPS